MLLDCDASALRHIIRLLMKLFCRPHPQNKSSSSLRPTSLYHRSPCCFPRKSSGLLPLWRELASKTEGVLYVKSDSRSLAAIPSNAGHTLSPRSRRHQCFWHVYIGVFPIGTTWVVIKDSTHKPHRALFNILPRRILSHPLSSDVPERGYGVGTVYF